MNIECLDDIITNNLAINIDLSNINSWDENDDFVVNSLTKWHGAVSDNINLQDYGLTGFDIGKTSLMWNGIKQTPLDNLFKMSRVGYNIVTNPTPYQTSGSTITTQYDLYPISAVTSGDSGNYFMLDGGYLNGYFKLKGYDYELLPSRYRNGITMETLLYLNPNSNGIFLLMGSRAEDKYNPHFSGETISGSSNVVGVVTSEDNYLDSFVGKEKFKSNFKSPEDNKTIEYSEPNLIDNIRNNIISFEINNIGQFGYKYVNDKGLIISDYSDYILDVTGFTMVSIVYKPYDGVRDDENLRCIGRRLGNLIFYVNGHHVWYVNDFPEFYFNGFDNDREKQIGVPYNINWGGGSFGLKHSMHYDYQTYSLYDGEGVEYIKSNFIVDDNRFIGDNTTYDLSIDIDNTTFQEDVPINVIKIECTGTTNNKYYIKYNKPVSILSNREYEIDFKIYDDNFFKARTDNGYIINNKITILPYSDDVDINIVKDTEYVYPASRGSLDYVIGQNKWLTVKSTFMTEDNMGQKFINIGFLIETDGELNLDGRLFIRDFKYKGADILTKDKQKNNLLIEQNFNNSFIGGIQKLRIYDNALTSLEIVHNTIIESKIKDDYITINKGGRIIYR